MKRYLFLIIIFLAFLLRFLFLGTNPPSLTWDETAWGYNAYSIGIDAKDEFGKFLPLTYIESFGDFKPPTYMYLSVLPIKIFGLNEFSVRFASAFFGVLSVLVTYYLVHEIFSKKHINLALLSAFVLAISPWHIMLSRGAFEANVATFFVLFGMFLFFKSVNSKPYLLIFSAISFVFSMYTFNSPRIVVPVLVVILCIVYFKKLVKNFKITFIAGIAGILLFLPLFLFVQTPQAQLRFNEVNIFTDISIIKRTNQEIKNDNNAFFSKIIHNRRLAYGVEYVRHYFDNLTPKFLFITGDGNPKFSIQDVGQLYIWEIPFFIAGIIFLFRKREGHFWIVPVWLLVGIIPAGFARETPHALRIESSLPMFQILTAIGVYYLLTMVSKNTKAIAAGVLSFVIFINFVYFSQNYFVHYSPEFSSEWQYGYKEAVNYADSARNNYKNIYITESLGRPYIYFLFYSRYSPQAFRSEAEVEREVFGFVHVNSFSNYKFTKNIAGIRETGALYISRPQEKPEKGKILKEFKSLNGKIALIAYTI